MYVQRVNQPCCTYMDIWHHLNSLRVSKATIWGCLTCQEDHALLEQHLEAGKHTSEHLKYTYRQAVKLVILFMCRHLYVHA